MNDYNQYVTAVNKIFDYLEKMKAGWNNMDNLNYIESIEEYKQDVIRTAELVKAPPTAKTESITTSAVETLETLEGLEND